LLDDGNRPRLREIAASYGSGYIARSDNAHYKAGNLSDGIAPTRERGASLAFRAIVDGDVVPGPEFIRTPLPVPKDGSLGIVQTPQCLDALGAFPTRSVC
jgi:cellulose synthase (UDP-forming)